MQNIFSQVKNAAELLKRCIALEQFVFNKFSDIFFVLLRQIILTKSSDIVQILVMLFVLLWTHIGVAQLADSPWPTRCHDEKHTCQSQYMGPDIGSLKWKFQGTYGFHSSPTIGLDGTIYIGSYDDYLYAINPDGSMKWKFKTNGDVKSSAVIDIHGNIYFGSTDDYLYAVKNDGTLKWKYDTGDINSSPSIGPDGTIYVSSTKGLYALNADGTYKWSKYLLFNYYDSSPTIDSNGTIYIGRYGNYNLYAINPDGSIKWEFYSGQSPLYPSIGPDSTIYFSSGSYLYALNFSGSLKWKLKAHDYRTIDTYPAIDSNGTIYIGVKQDKFYAINPDGGVKWSFEIGNNSCSSPAISSDGIIYFGAGHFIYALNIDGSLIWKYEINNYVASSPAISSDQSIYFGSSDGYVYAIGKKTGPSIAFSDTTLDFGPVQIGDSKTLNLTIFNTGNAALSVTNITSSSQEFVVYPTSIIVPSDSSQNLSVTFTPLTEEYKFAILTIKSNDPVIQESIVKLKGNIFPTNLRLYLCNPIVDFVSRLPDLCDVPETSGNNYEWQFITQRSNMVWDNYFLPFDINGNQFKLHVNCSENSTLSQVFFRAQIYIGGKEVFSKDFYVSGSSYKPYSEPFIFTSDDTIYAKYGEEVMVIIANAPSLGLGSIQWGSGIESYIEIPVSPANSASRLETIEVSPSLVNMEVGTEQMFIATGKDSNGNQITIETPVWETSGGGTLSPNGSACTYRATQVGDFNINCREGTTAIVGTASVHITITGVEMLNVSPVDFSLSQNYPNPFNNETIIQYSVKEPCYVILKVFNILGCEIATLVDAEQKIGQHAVRFDASNLSSGIYIYSIRMKSFKSVQKMVLMQ